MRARGLGNERPGPATATHDPPQHCGTGGGLPSVEPSPPPPPQPWQPKKSGKNQSGDSKMTILAAAVTSGVGLNFLTLELELLIFAGAFDTVCVFQ